MKNEVLTERAGEAMRRIGYVRITSIDIDEDLQRSTMRDMGCYCLFEDVSLTARRKRPGLAAMLETVRNGDTLIVWRLDHLDLTAQQFVAMLDRFKQQNINIIAIQNNIDTTPSGGSSMLEIIAVIAQMERGVLNERDIGRVAVAADADRPSRGRPTILSEALLDNIERLMTESDLSTSEVARTVGVSRATLYRGMSMLRAMSRLSAEPKGTGSLPGASTNHSDAR